MDRVKATNLIKDTFDNSYNESKFKNFIVNIFKDITEDGKSHSGQYIMKAYREHITSYKRLFKYELEQGRTHDKIDILAVKMTSLKSLETARNLQRNFIASYMKSKSKDAVIVAFYTDKDNGDEWRFSFVKRDLYLDGDKIKDDLTPAKRYSYLVGKNESTHTAQQQLVTLLEKELHNPTIKEIEEAFSIEKVSKEFFNKYKELYLTLVERMENIIEKDELINIDFTLKKITPELFCKKLLGQIVFLYFLQKKGWLGVHRDKKWDEGNKKFLRNLFTCAELEEKNYFNDYLEPFFYEALATERDGDWYDKLQCKIPFLNGGLFEPINGYDWIKTDILIPNELFSNKDGNGILDTLDTYNFTVKEDEPLEKEVAVDPEMLGKVFEELLPIKDRKSDGAFYTPREVVHYMCQESLVHFLFNKLNGNIYSIDNSELPLNDNILNQEIKISKEDLRDFIKFGDVYQEITKNSEDTKTYKDRIPSSIKICAKDIDNALKNVKICDPAIGSGAFPVGVMHEVIKSRRILVEAGYISEAQKRSTYRYKKEFIQNSLYGVDINESAIEIAKLRLWLSLIVDEDNRDNIEPLPNLDYKLVKGNSLLSIDTDKLRDIELLEEIEKAKDIIFDESSKGKKQRLKTFVNKSLAEYYDLYNKITGDNVLFDFKVNFSEVFRQNNGFDIIIGNPPYIQEYENRNAFDGLRKSDYYRGKMDIWHFFGSYCLDLLKEGGIQSFIAKNNWITNAGASKFRNKVLLDSQILSFIDFRNYMVFENAAVQTMIYFLEKSSKLKEYSLDYSSLDVDKIDTSELKEFLYSKKGKFFKKYKSSISRELSKDSYIEFNEENINSILNKISNKSNYKLNSNNVTNGIHHHHDYVNKKRREVLGNNFLVGDGIFCLTNKEKDSLNLTDKEQCLVKPSFTTKQISKYYTSNINTEWVIYTDSSFKDINKMIDYPSIKNHLDKFIPVISSDNKPYGLHRARKESFFKGEKIVSIRKCSNGPVFSYSDFDAYVSATFYVIKTDDINMKYLTAVLNSKLVAFWLRYKGKMQGNNYQVDKEPLVNIPLISNPNNILDFISIIDNILQIKENSTKSDTSKLESKIDSLVYQLYGMSEEDIAIIEGREPKELIVVTEESLIDKAYDLCEQHGFVDIKTIAKSFNINIDENKNVTHGQISFDSDMNVYTINVKDEKDNFTIAHEICHIPYHNDDIMQYKAVGRKDDYSKHQSEEYKVNQLAEQILMPEDFVRNYVKDDLKIDSFISKSSDIKKIAKKFKVSTDIAKFRLQNLGYSLANTII
jgi:Zn-dependent peptidase ImmA (M78 family)